jgi:AcrR family transcriptional regulator
MSETPGGGAPASRAGSASSRRRERFMRDGYEHATVRRIASDAGVDVTMVYYFFGNKEGLFTAWVVDVP